MSWVLAIDFGTSNTTAAFADDGGSPQLLQVENSQYLPSVVVADSEGNLLTGKAASRQAMVYPERTERVPKRALVAGGEVVLGGRSFAVEALAGAVLLKVYAEAVRFHGGSAPAKVILTHPARWGEILRKRLRAAAKLAGIDSPVLLAEPEAAAWYYAAPVAGQLAGVFDLGGGTLDTAVLKASDGGFAVAGPPGGDAELGGEDFDELLLDWVSEQASRRDAQLWAELEGPRAARDRALLRADVTAGKEALSEHTTYEVPVPGFPEGIHIRRPDLEELIKEPVERAVEEMRRTITAAGATPEKLTGLYLTGGSSRIPVIAQRLAVALGVLPQLRDDPKAVVVLGALKASAAPPPRAVKQSNMTRERTVIWPAAEQPAAGQPATGQPATGQPATGQPADKSAADKTPGKFWRGQQAKPASRPLPSSASIALELVKKFENPTGVLSRSSVAHVAWTPAGDRLAVGGSSLEIWDTRTGKRKRYIIWRISQPIHSLAWSPKGLELATIEVGSSTVKIWKDDIMRKIAVPGVATGAVLAWSPVNDHLAVADAAGNICVVDARTCKEVRRIRGGARGEGHPCVAWSPDGRFLVGSSSMSAVSIWRSDNGQFVRTLGGHAGGATPFAWSRDGKYLAVCDHAGMVQIWDPATGGHVRSLAYAKAGRNDVVRSVLWTDDSRYVVAFRPDGQLNGKAGSVMSLWDVASGTRLQEWRLYNEKNGDPCAGIALAPAGKVVAIVIKGAFVTTKKITAI